MREAVKQIFLFVGLLVLRIPFLFAGYGAEEDSWGHVLTTSNIHLTGVYEISRLPGHPVYDALLMILWNVQTPILFNLISAIFSAACGVAFYQLLKYYSVKNAILWSVIFSLIPTFFISSTYTIDYVPALFFMLLALLATLHENEERGAIWLAVATGFRITSLGFLVPLSYLILTNKTKEKSVALRLRRVFKLVFISLLTSCFFYLLPLQNYGISFFDFHKPPYPDLLEAFYKMTIGVWGVLGIFGLAFGTFFILKNKKANIKNPFFILLVLTAIVYGIAYWRMPEKAAFWIPTLPFVLLFFAKSIPNKKLIFVLPFFLAAPFFFGIEKAHPHTGSNHSAAAVTFSSSNGTLFFDPLYGPIFNNFSKRQNKLRASEKIEHSLMLQRQPTLVIAGWWYAMLEVDRRAGKWSNANIKTVYYASPKELKEWQLKGYHLRYLPEQDHVNDKKYNSTFTVDNATLFPID